MRCDCNRLNGRLFLLTNRKVRILGLRLFLGPLRLILQLALPLLLPLLLQQPLLQLQPLLHILPPPHSKEHPVALLLHHTLQVLLQLHLVLQPHTLQPLLLVLLHSHPLQQWFLKRLLLLTLQQPLQGVGCIPPLPQQWVFLLGNLPEEC
jgi:hypothetical protein